MVTQWSVCVNVCSSCLVGSECPHLPVVSGGVQPLVRDAEPPAGPRHHPHGEEEPGAEGEPGDPGPGPPGAAAEHRGRPHAPPHLPGQVTWKTTLPTMHQTQNS